MPRYHLFHILWLFNITFYQKKQQQQQTLFNRMPPQHTEVWVLCFSGCLGRVQSCCTFLIGLCIWPQWIGWTMNVKLSWSTGTSRGNKPNLNLRRGKRNWFLVKLWWHFPTSLLWTQQERNTFSLMGIFFLFNYVLH